MIYCSIRDSITRKYEILLTCGYFILQTSIFKTAVNKYPCVSYQTFNSYALLHYLEEDVSRTNSKI